MTADSANSHHTSGSRQVRSAARAEQPDARVAWHNLLQVSTRVIREFDRRLDREHRISAREFDVLINLDNAPDRRLRMTELANVAMLSSGGLTRLVGRLEGRGFVRRDQDSVDARAFYAKLTDTGGPCSPKRASRTTPSSMTSSARTCRPPRSTR